MVCVIGCCEDKDIDGILTEASRGGDKFFFTKAKSNPRAADPRTCNDDSKRSRAR